MDEISKHRSLVVNKTEMETQIVDLHRIARLRRRQL